jgi:hypothetical protein
MRDSDQRFRSSEVQFTTTVMREHDAGTYIRKRCPSEVTS